MNTIGLEYSSTLVTAGVKCEVYLFGERRHEVQAPEITPYYRSVCVTLGFKLTFISPHIYNNHSELCLCFSPACGAFLRLSCDCLGS